MSNKLTDVEATTLYHLSSKGTLISDYPTNVAYACKDIKCHSCPLDSEEHLTSIGCLPIIIAASKKLGIPLTKIKPADISNNYPEVFL